MITCICIVIGIGDIHSQYISYRNIDLFAYWYTSNIDCYIECMEQYFYMPDSKKVASFSVSYGSENI